MQVRVKRNALLFLIMWIFAFAVNAEPLPDAALPKMTEERARDFVYVAIEPHNKGIDLVAVSRADDPSFYFFQASWGNPDGSPIIGYYAVNPWTGDVWDQGCRNLHSKSLARLRSELRKKLHIDQANYLKLHSLQPIC